MGIENIITLIENKGVGFALIVAVAYIGWLLVKGVKKALGDFYALAYKFVHNHAAHYQDSLEILVRNSTEANQKLDAQTAKLDAIAEQTRPKT